MTQRTRPTQAADTSAGQERPPVEHSRPRGGLAGFDDVSEQALRRRRTVKWSYYDADVLPAWVAEMDFATAPAVMDAVQDAVRREQFGYPTRDADSGLPAALAAWSGEHWNYPIDPTRVHLLPDVLRGVELAIEYYSPAGSPVILPTPAYMPFSRSPGWSGVRSCRCRCATSTTAMPWT